KIIVKEKWEGVEYIAQGTVTSVNKSTGAVTINEWESGSTFPSGGYTQHATVFKWQREYWPIHNNTLDEHMDAITQLTLRVTNGNETRTVWIDDFRSAGGDMTDSEGSEIESSAGKQYMQYRAIFTSTDLNVSAQ